MFERRAERNEQQEMWIVRKEIAQPRVAGFYQKLDQTLKKCGFAEEVWKLCLPHYAEEKKGGPARDRSGDLLQNADGRLF